MRWGGSFLAFCQENTPNPSRMGLKIHSRLWRVKPVSNHSLRLEIGARGCPRSDRTGVPGRSRSPPNALDNSLEPMSGWQRHGPEVVYGPRGCGPVPEEGGAQRLIGGTHSGVRMATGLNGDGREGRSVPDIRGPHLDFCALVCPHRNKFFLPRNSPLPDS